MAKIWCELNTMQIQTDQDAYKCSICCNIFTSPIQLTVHCIVLHGLLPCMHCLKLFGTEHLLNQHICKQHAQLSYNCPECCDVFEIETDRCFHMTRKHFKKQCPLCIATILYDDFQCHITTMHKITNTIAATAVTTDNIILFEKFCTISINNRKQIHCHLCQDKKCMNRLDKLIIHLLYFHKLSLPSILRCMFSGSHQLMNDAGNDIDDDLPIANKCDSCGSVYSYSIPKLFHQIYCHGSIYCANCRNCFENNQIYDEHLENCRRCNGKQLPTIKFCDDDDDEADCNITDVIHLETVHQFSANCDFSKIENRLINSQNDCNFCGDHLSKNRALSLDNIIKHFRLKHKFNANAILRCLNKRNDDMAMVAHEKCHISSKRSIESVLSPEQCILIEHVLDDTSIEYRMDFAANIVRYVYSSESDYDSLDTDDDADTIHSRAALDRFYRCELCRHLSKSKHAHVMHMSEKHGFQFKTPEFRCNVCRKHLRSAHFLKKHNEKFHHKAINGNGDNDRPKRFKCPFCEFRCNAKTKMRYLQQF